MMCPMKALQKITVLIAVSAAAPAIAADFNDPTWPCVQRKVPTLSIGQMWTGPLIDEDVRPGDEIEQLSGTIAVRRTPLEKAGELIDGFASDLEEDERGEALAMLFRTVFERINEERSSIIAGIGRYAQKQTALSERIDTQRDEIVTLDGNPDKTNDEWDKLEEMQDILVWDERIYKERAQSLTYVCETPVLLEKRAFSLARKMAEHLE